ncbi:MAG: TatD family hydrolase [Phycisphaerales bacterium]
MIDTHCHLTFPDFAGRIDEVLDEARGLGVTGAITISTTSHDAEAIRNVVDSHDNVWCSAGVHPLYSDKGPHDWDAIHRLARHPKCVAFGELGLDNHYSKPPSEVQRRVLADQLARLEQWKSEGLAKPVVLHCREAFDDLIPILRETSLDPSRFVFHCFTGTPEDARKALDFGAMISFTGVVTYKNAPEVAEAAALVPLDRIMCETDAPFLSPEPKRGVRPCVPGFTRYTAEHVAKIKGLPFNEFHSAINANTERFFGIQIPQGSGRA